jgi:hypothetical protein
VPTPVETIADTLSHEFDVTAERAADDVAEFLNMLKERGLIEYTAETG